MIEVYIQKATFLLQTSKGDINFHPVVSYTFISTSGRTYFAFSTV